MEEHNNDWKEFEENFQNTLEEELATYDENSFQYRALKDFIDLSSGKITMGEIIKKIEGR